MSLERTTADCPSLPSGNADHATLQHFLLRQKKMCCFFIIKPNPLESGTGSTPADSRTKGSYNIQQLGTLAVVFTSWRAPIFSHTFVRSLSCFRLIGAILNSNQSIYVFVSLDVVLCSNVSDVNQSVSMLALSNTS